MNKPKWWVKPLIDDKKIYHGCINCGGTEKVLDLETRLYHGFGGWYITKDKGLYFRESSFARNLAWEEIKTLKEIEHEAKEDPDHDWRAILDLPLRGGQYQRHGTNKWVLIESNKGFA